MTPDAVIYRYLELVSPAGDGREALCLLLSTDADLLTRWLNLLAVGADFSALQEQLLGLDDAQYVSLAQSQAWSVRPLADSARLSPDQWETVLRAACLAQALVKHCASEMTPTAQVPSDDQLINVRLRALLAISGVHLTQDPMLQRLIEFRGIAADLLEDAPLELRVFAVIDALEVGGELPLAQSLLGLSADTMGVLKSQAEAVSLELTQSLGLNLNEDTDWSHKIWLRQQIDTMSSGLTDCKNLSALAELHQSVSRCLFNQPPLILCQHHADGPLILLEGEPIAIALNSVSSKVAACVRENQQGWIEESAQMAVADRLLLDLLGCEEAYAVPITGSFPKTVILAASNEDSDVDAAAQLYANEIASHLGRILSTQDVVPSSEEPLMSPLEAFRASEFARLREIVHEANNPLSIVHNYLHILQLRLQADPEVVDQLEMIAAELRRAGEVFTRARDVPEELKAVDTADDELSEIDVNAWVVATTELHTGFAAERGVTLHISLPSEPVRILTQSDKFTQVMTNLVKNAIEACALGDDVTIGLRASVVREGRMGVELFVQDSGPGLSVEVLQRLTEVKQTRKGGDHQGIGLQVAFKLTAELRGALDVRSEVGVGTTFSLFLGHPIPDGSTPAPD